MNQAVFFLQTCPICGRPTRVRVEWLGRQVRCQHCGGVFVAENPDYPKSESLMESAERWLATADQLLRTLDRRRVDAPEY